MAEEFSRACLCGCGTKVSPGNIFCPGHDSRFYNWLARYHVQGAWPGFEDLPEPTRLALMESDLPKSKLRWKKRWETNT